MASTKTVRFWFTEFTKWKTHKSILLPETFATGVLYDNDFHNLATVDFSSRQIAKKTLSVRKNQTANTNLGQTTRVNMDKFGIGNDVLWLPIGTVHKL